MKKLLALILCVMMFVSVMSMNAFADKPNFSAHPDLDTGFLAPKQNAASNASAISKARANIEYMYGALAADTAVFGTIKSVDGVITGLTKELFSGVDTFMGLPGGTVKSNTNAVLRDYIGSEIIRYMEKHSSDFETRSVSYKGTLSDGTLGSLTYTGKQTQGGGYIYVDKEGTIWGHNAQGWWKAPAGTNVTLANMDKNGDIVAWEKTNDVVRSASYAYDPIAYANTFAAAATNALSGKDGASMLENLAYQLFAAKVLKDTNDALDDLYDEIVDWEDGNAILSQYHFHDTSANGGWDDGIWEPYALLDNNYYPNAMAIPAAILAP